MKFKPYYKWALKDISMKRRAAILYWLLKNHGLYGPYPLYSKIEITQRCNLKCPQCLRTKEGMTEGAEMTVEQFKEVIDKLGPGMTEIWSHGFGEPLAHPYFLELMRYVRKKGMVWGVATNGTLFNRYDWSEFLSLQPTNIRFSIDAADPDLFYQLRYPARLDRLETAFRGLVQIRDRMYPKKHKWRYIQKRPLLSIYSVISKDTVDQIPRLVQMSKDWGADYISFSDMTWNNEYGSSTKETAIGTTTPWWDIMQLRAPYELDPTVKFSFPPDIKRVCSRPKSALYIDALGNTYFCTCVPGLEAPNDIVLGNIFDVKDVRELYNNDIANRFREMSCTGTLPNQSCRMCREWGPNHSEL
jgi:radical SAM protein with 4Fe4S-binding SPASM domain